MASERILVADDEPEIIDLCSRLLIGQGYVVQAATSGQEAIAHLEAEPFDLLVIDIKMPDMDGLAVLRRGRELDPDLAAVVITGFATMDSALEAMHSGARGFVLKPFGLQEFIQVAAEALEERRKDHERLRLRAQLPIMEIAQALLAESDPDRVAGQLLETVGREMAIEQALFALLDRQTNDLVVAGAVGLSTAEMDASRALRLPAGQGIVGQAVGGDKPVLLDGSASLEPSLQALLGQPDAKIMLVPLRAGKESVGVLILSRTASSRSFTASELDLMSILSTQIATALENAQLFRETERLRTFNESIVQSVAEAIVIEDAEGVITFVNPAMETLVGCARHELVGRPWSAIIPPDETEHRREQTTQNISRVASRYESVLLGKSGLGIPVILNARPLFEGERFVGVLSAITDITELKQAEDGLRRRNAEMAALNAVAAATSQSLDLEEILDAALGQTLEALEVEGGLIYLFDEASQSFIPAAHRGISQNVLREVTGFKLGVGLSGRVAESGEALVIADLGSDPRNISASATRLGWHSYAAVPIKSKGKPLGVMTLVTGQVGRFRPDHVELLGHIGSQVGMAIENARLYEQAQARSRYLETLQRINATLRSTLPLDEVLTTITWGAGETLGYVGSLIMVPDPAGERLVLGAAWGERFLEAADEFLGPEARSLSLPLASKENPIVLAFLDNELRLSSGEPERIIAHFEPAVQATAAPLIGRAIGARRTVCVPLSVGEKVLGVLVVFHPQERLTDEERGMLLGLADQAGLAIEHARLYQAAQQEIAERKRAERELADTKVLMEAAFEQTPIPMVLASMPDMAIRIANSASREFLGIQDEPDPIGTPLLEVKQSWQDLDSDGMPLGMGELPLALAFQGVTTRNKELRVLRKDGTERWELTNAAPIYNAAGELIAGFVAFPDITEAKRAEEALRTSESFLNSIIEQSPYPMWISDDKGTLIRINRACQDLLHISEEEVAGKYNILRDNIVEQQGHLQLIKRVFEAGETVRFEIKYDSSQLTDVQLGEFVSIFLDSTVFPIRDASGRITNAVIQHLDITERKRAEEALQKAKDELERQNAQLRALYHVGQMVNSTLEADAILAQLTDEAMRVTRATHGQVLVVREDLNRFERLAQRGFSPEEARRAHTIPLPLDQGVNGRAYKTRQAVRVDDVQTEAGYFPLIPSTRTELAVPIMREGRVLGNLDLQSPEAGAFQDADLDYLKTLADQGAIALGNARFYEEMERQNARLQALYRVGQMINSTLETDAILDNLTDEAMRITRATRGQVLVVRDDLGEFERRSMHGFSEEEAAWAHTARMHLDQGVNGHAYTTRQAVCLDDVLTVPYYLPAAWTTHAELAIPIMREGRVLGNLDLQSPEVGAFRDVDLDYLSALAGQVAIALENARLYDELRQRVAELTALNTISSAVATSLDLQQTLTVVTDYATQLLDVAATSIALKTEGGLWFAAASGEGSDFVLGRRMAPGQGITGWVVEHGQSLVVPDVSQDQRFFRDFLKESEFITRSILCVPLQTKEQTIGAIELVNKANDRFGPQDAQLLALLAAPAATAIENARLFEEVRAGRDRLQLLSRRLVEVQEAERRHIARELHDEVGQVLTGLKLTLEMGASLPPEESKANLEEAQALVNELMAEVRNLSLDLRPAMLDDLGLLPALLWHFERYTAQTQVHVTFKQIGLERRFQPEIETVVYRIIQEALTNVARHAGVDNVTVRVWVDDVALNVQVEDQGPGFDLEAALAAGISSGLSGMYERVGLLDGQLRIESIPEAGTSVTARLPLSGLGERSEKEETIP
jgi:PAS domain S-box-containing protein